ncbi:unnamed protein product [Dicrocoelium dendriticum]|nr:unnamed protein product [Dicrocoelium dendriticum]
MFHTIVGCMLLLGLVDSLVPKPKEQTIGTGLLSLNDQLTLEHDLPKCFILQDAFREFLRRLRLRPLPTNRSDPVTGNVQVVRTRLASQCDELKVLQWPSPKMKEQYTIVVDQDQIEIEAEEVWGVLHALQTIGQLVRKTPTGMYVIKAQRVVDRPRFIHRGFLIDTSRHYLPVEMILQFLEAMSMVKMNVLHWHIVDTESFPYMSYTYPTLSAKGAFDPNVFVYTNSDVRRITEHARRNGIRVVAEFDTPGHSDSWGRGHPEIMTQCFDGGKPDGSYGPINPTTPHTYEFLLSFLKEIVQVFPDELVHLGGDEVDFSCWKSNPEVRRFMEQMGFSGNYSLLQSYYMEQLIRLLSLTRPTDSATTPVVWQEVFDHGFRSNNKTIIHVWKKENWTSEMQNITEAGFRVLFSSCWYLNIISYGVDWGPYYECDPTDFKGTSEQHARVLGGEAAMWGEHVDETNFFSRSWPRGAVVAERLWSVGNLSRSEFEPRLNEVRCQMLRLGWNAEPVNGPGFCPV